jgi:hypothetical protein
LRKYTANSREWARNTGQSLEEVRQDMASSWYTVAYERADAALLSFAWVPVDTLAGMAVPEAKRVVTHADMLGQNVRTRVNRRKS